MPTSLASPLTIAYLLVAAFVDPGIGNCQRGLLSEARPAQSW
jgi:hypothetical protein